MRFRKTLIAVLFPLLSLTFCVRAVAQANCPCRSADLLYRPVVQAMWSQDQGTHRYAEASGFIRIAVHPAWRPEYFVDVKLNRQGAATVVLYSLPEGAKTVTVLLKKALKRNRCADVESLAKTLSVQKRSLTADKKMEELIAEFFSLRWQPRRIPEDTLRLDATEYELEYLGDDTFRFDSDDNEAPLVKWIDSFMAAVRGDGPG